MPDKERRETKTPKESQENDLELLQLIVNEVDTARDTLDIVNQLRRELPIRRFDDIRRAVGSEGIIRFRGQTYPISWFEDMLPSIVYPIEDLRVLVERTSHIVRLIPDHVAGSPDSPQGTRRYLHTAWLQPPNGLPPRAISSGPLPTPTMRATTQGATRSAETQKREEN